MSKRTLDGFFAAEAKKPRTTGTGDAGDRSTEKDGANGGVVVSPTAVTRHDTYPWPVAHLPPHLTQGLERQVTAQGREIRNQPHMDLLYFQPFVPHAIQRALYEFLRAELFFYRVRYTIKRLGTETVVNTPRFTTVFGVDETSRFAGDAGQVVEAADPSRPVRRDKYRCRPRPIPECLDVLRRVTEACTDTRYNVCLVNYYASGSDSISFHSDDEHFLGPDPAIASFTLGARRDFLMKHKPPRDGPPAGTATAALKMALASGDLVVMRGPTQAHWLHSIPKRKGADADQGRINITLRRALMPAGTDNYYRYNVGDGAAYRWDPAGREMMPWPPPRPAR